MEFTAEQQVEIKRQIDEAVAKATQGMRTQDDFDKELQREVDRRVETGIQKGLDTHKEKWKAEFEADAKLTADELAQKQLQLKLDSLNERESDLARKSNRVDAINALAEAKVPASFYNKLLDKLVTDDSESTLSNVETLIANYGDTRKSIEDAVKAELADVNPPAGGGGGGGGATTKADFEKMTYSDKIKFKAENPDKFKEFIS